MSKLTINQATPASKSKFVNTLPLKTWYSVLLQRNDTKRVCLMRQYPRYTSMGGGPIHDCIVVEEVVDPKEWLEDGPPSTRLTIAHMTITNETVVYDPQPLTLDSITFTEVGQ